MKGTTKKGKGLEKDDPSVSTNYGEPKPVTGPSVTKNLSDRETQQKLELYKRLAEKSGQSYCFKNLQEKYKAEMGRREQIRVAQHVHFAAGWRVGLHSNNNQIKEAERQSDQILRDQTNREGKEEYDKRIGLNKEFPKDEPGMRHEFARSKHRGMDKDR